MKNLLSIIIILFSVFSCKIKKTELIWQKSFGQIGSQSSPNTADFNGDGILDIVIGAGKNEYEASDFGVMVLDGKTGEIIWKTAASDQIYQTATLLDINNDKTDDVIIGGRSNNLFALDGKTGKQIWKFKYKFENDSILKHTKYNFQNTKIIPDQNGDGLVDLLVQEGGNHKAKPGTMNEREAGVLMVLNSKTGQVLFADKMPDGMESYMPPLYFKQPDNEEYIVFGTGGETISGNLFITKFADLKSKNLRNAKIIAEDSGHGFIAPSLAADINNDGYFDIISISHGSKISAIDGKSLNPIWQNNVPNTECSNAFAVGNFNNDNVPDFFTFVSKGIWPDSKGSEQIMIDGKTGKIEYQNNMGCTGFSSAVVYDLNHDGADEAIISINEYDCEKGFVNNDARKVVNKLLAIDFVAKKAQIIDEIPQFKNIFSTPLLTDIDHDNYLDIVHFQYYSALPDPLLFMGMQAKRISTNVKLDKPITWGKYMGSGGDGIFKK